MEIAGKILSSRMKKEVVDIALAHHERCDGSGYPKKLTDIIFLKLYIVLPADRLILPVKSFVHLQNLRRLFRDKTEDPVVRLHDNGDNLPFQLILRSLLFQDRDHMWRSRVRY